MKITITFRQMPASDALRQYAQEKIGRLERFDDGIREAHATLTSQRESHKVEISVHAGRKALRAVETSENMYASLDLATDKLARQLKRAREKRTESPRRGGETIRHEQASPRRAGPAAAAAAVAATPTGAGRIRLVSTFNPKPMFLDDVVMEMDARHDDFFVFLNAESDQVNVLYRLPKGGYGLVEPEA